MQQVGMIVVCDLGGLIGYDGKLPWHNKTDLKRFKKLTMGGTLIMGRKTYDSLPVSEKTGKKLGSRLKHVLSYHASEYTDTEDTKWFRNWDKALLACSEKYDECKGTYTMYGPGAPDYPLCSCGEASTYEIGWCGRKKPIWIIGGESIYREALMLNIPDFIDLTIMNFIHIGPVRDSIRASLKKSSNLPHIPYMYMVESEIQNKDDKTVWHRRYVKRPGGFSSSFIESIRDTSKSKIQLKFEEHEDGDINITGESLVK